MSKKNSSWDEGDKKNPQIPINVFRVWPQVRNGWETCVNWEMSATVLNKTLLLKDLLRTS